MASRAKGYRVQVLPSLAPYFSLSSSGNEASWTFLASNLVHHTSPHLHGNWVSNMDYKLPKGSGRMKLSSDVKGEEGEGGGRILLMASDMSLTCRMVTVTPGLLGRFLVRAPPPWLTCLHL